MGITEDQMEAAAQFGRGTPAGNAIFKLYNKKSMDSTLDPELLARLQKMRKEKEAQEAAATKVKVVPKSQVHVSVPKFSGRQKASAEQIALSRLEAMGHRKREADIREEASSQPPAPPPQPARPLITEADKDKLVQIFQFGEALPAITDSNHVKLSGANAVRFRKPNESDILESRFDELGDLLREKRQYLADVKSGLAGGKNPVDRRQTELIVTNEIASTIAEMKEIDEKLRKLSGSESS